MYFLQLYIVLIIKKMQNDFPRSVFRGDLLYFFRRKSLFFLRPVASAFRINPSSVSYLRQAGRPLLPELYDRSAGSISDSPSCAPCHFCSPCHLLYARNSCLRVICAMLAIPALRFIRSILVSPALSLSFLQGRRSRAKSRKRSFFLF